MRLFVVFAPLFVVACVEGNEQDPEATGPVDADSDGLTDDEEATLGTDPDEADSDGDGLDDPDELEVGTNPLFEYSVPLDEGDYVLGTCPVLPSEDAGPTGEGRYDTVTWEAYQVGDTVLNWTGVDPYRQEVSVYNFCGNYTLVSVGAEWCGPCQDLAATLAEEAEQMSGRVENFTFFELLSQDISGGLPSVRTLGGWEEEYGLYGIPVVGPDSQESADELGAWDVDGYIPSTILLSPDMRVISMDEGVVTPRAIVNAIEDWEEAEAAE